MRVSIGCAACVACVACAPRSGALSRCTDPPVPSAITVAQRVPDRQEISIGPLVFEVTIARTAQLFYFVDQICRWSPHSHEQYARWADQQHLLGDREGRLLEVHKRLRVAYGGWGALDQAFASTRTIREAASVAAAAGPLSKADADAEVRVLESFEPLLAPVIDEGQSRLAAFRHEIGEQATALGRVLADIQTFAETYTASPIPLFLVVDPVAGTGGGGYNGGIAWVEVGDVASAIGTLSHEAVHVVLRERRPDIGASAAACGEGLDDETLNEGITYAVFPGMAYDGRHDPLAEDVEVARRRGRPATDPYVRDRRLGLALRPLLAATLASKSTLKSFFPKACAAWRSVAAEAWP